MMIHLTRIHHLGVYITIKTVSNKMFVLEKLGSIVKRIRTDCSKCRIILKKITDEILEYPELSGYFVLTLPEVDILT